MATRENDTEQMVENTVKLLCAFCRKDEATDIVTVDGSTYLLCHYCKGGVEFAAEQGIR